jgi:hypothetical protein
MEVENYSREHGNDFGLSDGRDRIPMKKLMKLFEIKKKTAPEKQNLFRQIVNDHCDLEMMEGFGKVLVLKQNVEGYHDESSNSDDEPDYGYGNGDPTMADTVPELKKADSDGDLGSSMRTGRFKPPQASASGGLSVATVESVGVYDRNNGNTRRTGYRRRGSVTRYSIVGHEQVVNEYKKHEDVINQFRRDSLKLEHSIRNLTLETSKEFTTNDSEIDKFQSSPKRLVSPMANKDVPKASSVKKLFGRTRFSLAF